MLSELDYPVAAPDGVAPIIYRAQIIQTMALQYLKAMAGSPEDFDLSNAMEAAMATWETDWDDDPAPRTLEAGIEAANADLVYWAED